MASEKGWAGAKAATGATSKARNAMESFMMMLFVGCCIVLTIVSYLRSTKENTMRPSRCKLVVMSGRSSSFDPLAVDIKEDRKNEWLLLLTAVQTSSLSTLIPNDFRFDFGLAFHPLPKSSVDFIAVRKGGSRQATDTMTAAAVAPWTLLSLLIIALHKLYLLSS